MMQWMVTGAASPIFLTPYVAGTNKLTGVAYDGNGNETNFRGNNVSYDAEGRVASVVSGSTTLVSYQYDGDGRRVQKTTPSGTTTYVYDASGALMAEYAGAALSREYVRFHSSFIGSNVDLAAIENASGNGAPCSTCFVVPDYLGNVRMVADNAGHAVSRHDYLPFGEEASADAKRPAAAGFALGDGATQRFTAKERDSESGLDYLGARYYGSALGRMTSPDPHTGTMLHVINPQRWNMYAYGMNNPLSYVDPDGRDAIAVGFKTLAAGAGHAALISVHRDGSATFGSYGPKGGGKPVWPGQYVVQPLKTQIKFGSDGEPLVGSLAVLAGEVADLEGVDPSTVDMDYFMTSDTDTQILDQYFDDLSKRSGGLYVVGMHDCIEVCNVGLNKIGIGR